MGDVDMASMAPERRVVIGGIDTHKDIHVAAVLDTNGAIPGTEQFPTTRQGYRRLLAWMRVFGELRCVGTEGPVAMGRESHATRLLLASRYSRLIGRIGLTVDYVVRVTRSMLRP